MEIILRKIELSDKKYFAKWWRDKDLLKLTSGVLKKISDKQIDKYFSQKIKSIDDFNFIITVNKKAIGHISLNKKKNNWYETQIIIGEKDYWGKGYGTKAIKQLIKEAKTKKISRIYLEVRPDNLRAIRSYKKCGFREIKIINYPKNKFLSKTLKMRLK